MKPNAHVGGDQLQRVEVMWFRWRQADVNNLRSVGAHAHAGNRATPRMHGREQGRYRTLHAVGRVLHALGSASCFYELRSWQTLRVQLDRPGESDGHQIGAVTHWCACLVSFRIGWDAAVEGEHGRAPWRIAANVDSTVCCTVKIEQAQANPGTGTRSNRQRNQKAAAGNSEVPAMPNQAHRRSNTTVNPHIRSGHHAPRPVTAKSSTATHKSARYCKGMRLHAPGHQEPGHKVPAPMPQNWCVFASGATIPGACAPRASCMANMRAGDTMTRGVDPGAQITREATPARGRARAHSMRHPC